MFLGYRLGLRPGPRLAHGPRVLMLFHPNARSVEDYAFQLQSDALIEAVFARQRNFSFGSYDPMPGQPARCTSQRPHYLTGAARKARRAGDVAISGDFALGNLTNGVADDFQHDALLHGTEGSSTVAHALLLAVFALVRTHFCSTRRRSHECERGTQECVRHLIECDTRQASGAGPLRAKIGDRGPGRGARRWCRPVNRERRLRAAGRNWMRCGFLRSFAADPKHS